MNRKKQAALYLASAGIPCVLLLCALMAAEALPFGNNTILISDAWGQYMDFLSLWKRVLSGEADLFYTFSKTMGGDMLNLAAYYLLSPFNLLFLFSDLQNLPLFYTATVILKISACGLTFFYAAGRLWGVKPSGLIFSTAYALSAYNMLYGWNLMWLDGVLILPLLALGLHRLLETGQPWLYCLSLFYSLATNFYIGYMLCITAVLLFAAEIFVRRCSLNQVPRYFGRFCTASIVGGLGAGAVWLPTFLSLAGERSQMTTTQFLLTRNFSVYGFLPKLLSGAASTSEMAGGTPHVFCGTALLLMAALLLLDRKTGLRLRLAFAGLLAAVFVSFWLQPLNIVWHGFSANNSFNYRYAFMFTFFLLCGAQYFYEEGSSLPKKAVLLPGIALLAAFLLAIAQGRGFSHTIGSVSSLLALAVTLFCLCTDLHSRRCLLLIFTVTLLELGINSAVSWQELVTYNEMVAMDEYRDFVGPTQAAVDFVREEDPGFYRMEKNFHRTVNDPALFGYNGLSHFSSTEPAFTKQFMRKMGFSSENDFWAWYGDGSTAGADSLLGVKYLMSKEPLDGKKDYTLLQEQDGIFICRNDSALPIAFLCNNAAATVSMEAENPITLHNGIWQALTGRQDTVLHPQAYTVSTQNLTIIEESAWGTVYEKTDPEQDAFIRYEATASEELPLYVYFSAPDYQQAELYINGEYNNLYFHMNHWNQINTGTHSIGETVVAELRLLEDTLTVTDCFFSYEDPTTLSSMTASLQKNAPTLIPLSGSRLEGSFTAPEDRLLMFTIPYNEGWKLQIDGVEVPCTKALDTFLAAEVSSGDHTFSLRYMPRGFLAGCCLSAASLSMAGIWLWLLKKKETA